MNGILALWKEKGMTSHDCVFKLRKLLQTKKIGHTGTLDPNVSGVLPICVGSATKMVEFLMGSKKAYSGEITIGFSTTTEDADGDTVEKKAVEKPFTPQQIDALMKNMTGELTQIPPMYSAVKVNGKRLYEYARENKEVTRPKRQIVIYSFVRTSPIDYHNETASFTFDVTCSKGTYIRTLAVDLGAKLGFPSHMSQLKRTQSANFYANDCVTLEQLEKLTIDERKKMLQPIEKAAFDYPKQTIDDTTWQMVKNGAVIKTIPNITYPAFFVYQGYIKALYDEHPTKKGYIKPIKMLLTNGE